LVCRFLPLNLLTPARPCSGIAITIQTISQAGLGMGGIDVNDHPAQTTPGTNAPSGKSRF
jgi:hypothetical protein